VIGFPLLIVPFAIYNMIAFLTPFDWNTKLFPGGFRLPSGLVFEPTASDAFVLFSLLMLMFEVIKTTKHGRSLVEHFLILLLVCGAAAEFAMVNPTALMNVQNVPQQMGNSTFALFVAMCRRATPRTTRRRRGAGACRGGAGASTDGRARRTCSRRASPRRACGSRRNFPLHACI
jgi:hypothetical protein